LSTRRQNPEEHHHLPHRRENLNLSEAYLGELMGQPMAAECSHEPLDTVSIEEQREPEKKAPMICKSCFFGLCSSSIFQ
jgi:hypothetical protein